MEQTVNIDAEKRFTFFNHIEEILTSPAGVRGDTLYLEMPVYNTFIKGIISDSEHFSGYWYNPEKGGDYKVPVTASFLDKQPFIPVIPETEYSTYDVVFSPNTPEAHPAVGAFYKNGQYLHGTFMTETGDYRYLQGKVNGDRWTLSCFDGSHLFHFDILYGDSTIEGTFRSGKHWKETFSGNKSMTNSLRDPFTITYATSDDPIALTAINAEAEMIDINHATFESKVTILQLLGTWCPNCLDESLYLKELSNRINHDDLQIIGIAFERSNDVLTNLNRIKRYRSELGLLYDIHLGGKASKQGAAALFPMINEISSFPTTLIVDRNAQIKLIHTGFNGPGTGEVFDHFQERFENELNNLLREEEI